jgi:hypothetical protein
MSGTSGTSGSSGIGEAGKVNRGDRHRLRRRGRRRLLVAIPAAAVAVLLHAEGTLPTPLAGAGDVPPSPWQVKGLPGQRKPLTQFSVVVLDGRRVLRIEADRSYGNLVHPLQIQAASVRLAWQWRVDQPLTAADLRSKAGDDAAAKVCVLFDLPLDTVPFGERQLLRLARLRAGGPLPAATVCYVWDTHLSADTALDNAYTRRVRFIVLQGAGAPLGQWRQEKRDVVADFARLFGTESPQLPPIVAIAVGADSDNTQGHSVAYVAELELKP